MVIGKSQPGRWSAMAKWPAAEDCTNVVDLMSALKGALTQEAAKAL